MSTIESKAAVAATDLVVCITPRDCERWHGSRAQLEAEGLIPAGIKWPTGENSVRWSLDGFSYLMSRFRPIGSKGPKSAWVNGDYWHLTRRLDSSGYDGWRDAKLYEKRRALEDEIFRHSPAGIEQLHRSMAADADQRFQVFLSMVPGALSPTRQRAVLKSKARQSGGAA